MNHGLIKRRGVRCLNLLCLLLVSLALQGCYYMQAARGQIDIWQRKRPLDEVIADPQTDPALAARLELLREARDFATSRIGLPDNGSYRNYVDLEREHVLWNVIAAPELSLQPRTWCYFVVGCLAYRGYFDRDAAERLAARLRADGFDVYVGGVAAYSTLGRFNDPLLNTMLARSDADVIALLFHELAHQRLYVADDTAFNESFATAVAEFAMQDWFDERGESDAAASYFARQDMLAARMETIRAARAELAGIYLGAGSDADKRTAKAEVFARLREQMSNTPAARAHWVNIELNNAWLATVSLYRGQLPAFRQLHADCNEDWRCFFEAADRLAELEPAARTRQLALLEERASQG